MKTSSFSTKGTGTRTTKTTTNITTEIVDNINEDIKTGSSERSITGLCCILGAIALLFLVFLGARALYKQDTAPQEKEKIVQVVTPPAVTPPAPAPVAPTPVVPTPAPIAMTDPALTGVYCERSPDSTMWKPAMAIVTPSGMPNDMAGALASNQIENSFVH